MSRRGIHCIRAGACEGVCIGPMLGGVLHKSMDSDIQPPSTVQAVLRRK